MAKLKVYEITLKFDYANGTTPGGVLQTEVKGRPAIARQMEANREWLAARGHTETSVEVFEVGSHLHDAAVQRRANDEV
jgi:hypothetical protein